LDNQAAIECNEPAFRQRWVDTSYSSSGNRGAFSPDVHVYDMNEVGSCVIDPLYSNDYDGSFGKIFNYAIDHIALPGEIPKNSDNVSINRNDISTWTAFNHISYAPYYFDNMLGYNKSTYIWDGYIYTNRYPVGHNITVIVNKDPSDDSLCGSTGMPSCYRDWGFPSVAFDCDPINEPLSYKPSFSVDENTNENETEPDWPTIVMGATESGYDWYPHSPYKFASVSGTDHLGMVRHLTFYHEFTHYIQKAFREQASAVYWSGTSFDSDEDGTFKEGFAMYFGASMENASPHNFDKTNITCTSDEKLFDYVDVFSCCGGVYNRGKVLTQIFWDIRNGWTTGANTTRGLGKTYTDKLAYQTMFQGAMTYTDTLTDLYNLAHAIVLDELSTGCPAIIGDADDCSDIVENAFDRHGVCVTGGFCPYTAKVCNTGCSGVICPNGDVGSCPGVILTNCSRDIDLTCCTTDGYYDDVCNENGAHVAACGFTSFGACATDCKQDLWSHEFRECMRDVNFWGGCDCCVYACYFTDRVMDCGFFNSGLACYNDCRSNWDAEDFECLLKDNSYPESCAVCDI
jgi:hypothetical protein